MYCVVLCVCFVLLFVSYLVLYFYVLFVCLFCLFVLVVLVFCLVAWFPFVVVVVVLACLFVCLCVLVMLGVYSFSSSCLCLVLFVVLWRSLLFYVVDFVCGLVVAFLFFLSISDSIVPNLPFCLLSFASTQKTHKNSKCMFKTHLISTSKRNTH